MIFKVQTVDDNPGHWNAAQGGAMLTYYLTGSFDGGPTEKAQINTSEAKAKVPFVGEEIECTVTKDHPQYGKSIKRAQALQNSFMPGARQEDPARQESIIRQSSFERAILIQAKKADIFIAEKRYAEAHEAMKFKTITDLSDYIADYAKGQLINPPKATEEDINNFPIDDGPFSDEQ